MFGEGDPHADLMFVGEAPGYHEDQQGRPFVGQAGKLLEQLLASIGLQREQVFIANVLKSRPPNNRDPRPDEIAACEPYLWRQIALIQPRVICTLGNFATKLLTGDQTGITRVHGQPQLREIGGRAFYLYPIFHPAAALYTPAMLTTLREDFSDCRNCSPHRCRSWPARAPGCRCAGGRSSPALSRLPEEASTRGRLSSSASSRWSPFSWPRRRSRGASAVCWRGFCGRRLLVTLEGELGTGKTTLVRAALRALGVRGAITSPSFTMAQTYVGRGGTRLHHLDLYRLAPGDDAALFAWSDYLDDGSIVFVEWPEAAATELPVADVAVSLAHDTLTSRTARVLARPALAPALVAGLAGAGIAAAVTSVPQTHAREAS